MAKTLEQAKAKWAKKMKIVAPRWEKAKNKAIEEDRYRKGLEAMKIAVGTELPKAWADMLRGITASDFAEAVAGKEEVWARKFAEAVAR